MTDSSKPRRTPRLCRTIPLTLNLETVGGIAAPLIQRGTPLPAQRVHFFSTAEDDQSVVELKISVGESRLAKRNLQIGTFKLSGIPPARRGEPKVRVMFSVDRHCEIRVTASVDQTDLRVEGTTRDIQRHLTPKRLQAILDRTGSDQEAEAEEIQVIEARNNAEYAIARAEATLRRDQEEGISPQLNEDISKAIAKLGLSLESGGIDAVSAATAELEFTLEIQERASKPNFFDAHFGPFAKVLAAKPVNLANAPEQKQGPGRGAKKQTVDPARVFIVHGHDDAAKEGVARFIERLGLSPIILHEQPNIGRTIIEKLEHYASADFAVVLLTPDDVGTSAVSPSALRPRARQNVVLELGLFIGKLGRERVCALHRGDLELPSDYQGVLYIPIDPQGGWRLQLARELKEAGFKINIERAL